MRMRIGHRLLVAREDRKLTQSEMADLLNMSQSSYSRLERNDISVELEQILHFSKILQIPIQELLPEIIAINNNPSQNGQGFVMGNIYNYYDDKKISLELEKKVQENDSLREKIQFLESKIKDLEEIISLLKS
ncbi:MAG: helix-turn-helix transcriptional regulator [Thermonemataceae bacterium]|nr:helix-turn-helix transcriptional regulator [Thermonemataceae bacterium]